MRASPQNFVHKILDHDQIPGLNGSLCYPSLQGHRRLASSERYHMPTQRFPTIILTVSVHVEISLRCGNVGMPIRAHSLTTVCSLEATETVAHVEEVAQSISTACVRALCLSKDQHVVRKKECESKKRQKGAPPC